ncbi:MAG: complex I subunit 5 family protein [Muricoprocola sp.]
MAFVQNVPFFSIILSMFSGIVSSMLPKRAAKWLNTAVITIVGAMSAWLLTYMIQVGGSYTFMMGHFPAPWGNEIRAGALEAGLAFFFSIVMLLCVLGGRHHLEEEVESSKHNIYYIMTDLLLSSLLALVYTNDMFTAYVFVEINTIAACGLIMIRQTGRTTEAAVRYMIMSQLGSGLLLMGICMLYDLTGHLLMSNIRESVGIVLQDGRYTQPLMITIGLITVGLAIKSALFPFHAWLPNAYGYSTVSSAAMLSSLVSKGYIVLLIKIFYRVIGFPVICGSKIINILFIFGLCGMIFGSVSAIWEKDIRRMIAFSSVAQIGYIYMGIGMGTREGVEAAIFHILAHAATKSLLFISAVGLTDCSGKNRKFSYLSGAAYRNKVAGIGFTVGAFSMVGIPFFAGFISKILFAKAAVLHPDSKMLPVLIVLAVSTILNAVYFLKTVVRIYVPMDKKEEEKNGYKVMRARDQKTYTVTIILLIILNVVLGMCSEPIMSVIREGLNSFA